MITRIVSRCFMAVVTPALLFAASAVAQVPLTQISNDDFSNTTSQHETEVEPASHVFGNTIVSVFQVGRFTDGGASDIGFATSTDGGVTWTHGHLPGITTLEGTGPYDRASDPSVTYNVKHKLWLAETLGLSESGGPHGAAVLVSSSTDGITWNNPSTVSVVEAGGYYDKPWIGCDNTATSKYYGNCYVEWDDFSLGDLIQMSTSSDGGKTWGPKLTTADSAAGNGGLPMVQPNGNVIVPIDDPFLSSVLAFKSTNGGKSWSATVRITPIMEHGIAGGMRASPLIAAQVDAAGTVYVAWADCRFRPKCTSNDIVMTTSKDGVTWTTTARIPIDVVTGPVDHFIPGLSIKPGTSGKTAHIALTYYYFLPAACSVCTLRVGYVTSADGGAKWTAAKVLAKGIDTTWLPSTTSGQMVGDYMTSAFVGSTVHGVFAVAAAPVGTTFNEAMNTNQAGLVGAAPEERLFSGAHDKPVRNAHSDVPRRTKPYQEDHR
jgi:hypothetical protein